MQEARARRVWGEARRSRSAASSVALLLVACGGTDATPGQASPATPGASPDEAPPARFERVICPQCVEAGGETTDFGDGSAFVPVGSGIFAAPSPCELSETVSSIELDAARELGFAAVLDQLETTFDVPFEWTPTEFGFDGGGPARGYSPRTRVRGTTTALSAEHHVPSLEGCNESLLVQVATRLETDDGALSISGTLPAKIERDTRRPVISGYLDLSQARGTLELDPPPSSEAVLGYVYPSLYAWPDGMRLALSVGALNVRDVGSDSPSFFYYPLEAHGPLDGCNASDRPLAFDETTPTIGPDESVADRFSQVLSLITTQPLTASWMGGAQTSLDIDIGEPVALCDQVARIMGSAPYRLRSGDGRVDIDSDAVLMLSFTDGSLGAGWFEIYYSDGVLPAESFAEDSGISGVDFGAYGGGRWYTELLFDPAATYPRSGEVTVDAVDLDGSVTGTPSAVIDSIDSLSW